MQTVSNLVVIEEVANRDHQVQQGAMIERQIRVKNLVNQWTELDLWIAPIDSRSELLWKWCTFSADNPLVLLPYGEREITLTFDIPPQANLGLYGYEIIAETRSPALGQLIRRTQQLQVVRSDDLDRETTPHFVVQPATSSVQPLELTVGEPKAVTVQVENRSKRVDRFYLICSDLNPNWFTIQYPESQPTIPGLVTETDGLELNPGETETIQLVLHPPIQAAAGTYFPTVRLLSSIRNDLVLLNVIYLSILPCDRVIATMQPAQRRIPEMKGEFEICLFNQGNVQRNLAISAQDPEHLFEYGSDLESVRLLPGEQSQLILTARPRKWWLRPWWGKREFTFDLGLQLCPDATAEPVPYALADPPQGTIIWQSRPLWPLVLLLLLTLGVIGTIAFLLMQHFLKPVELPQVTQFKSTETGYQEGRSPMRLDWQISRFDQVQKLVLIRLQDGVETYRKNYEFNADATQPLPSELQPTGDQTDGFCQVLNTDRHTNASATTQTRWLSFPAKHPAQQRLQCQGIPTAAAPAGNYVFKLEVFSTDRPHSPVTTESTDSIIVTPPDPNPTIAAFSTTYSAYTVATESSPADPPLPSVPIGLNWTIAQPNQIQAVQWVGLAADGTLQSPMRTYAFERGMPAELSPFCTVGSTLQCRNVPTDVRQVGQYRFQLTVIPRQSNGEPVSQTTATIPVTAPPPQIGYFRVNGQEVTANPKQVFAIAASPDASGATASMTESSPDTPTAESPAESIVESDAALSGDAAPTDSPMPNEVTLSWQVADGVGIKVELLPAPGLVASAGSLSYPLSTSPRRETITLRVTNATGEQVSQTVVIETTRPPEPEPTPTPTAPAPQPSPDLNLPFSRETLIPIELPPQPN